MHAYTWGNAPEHLATKAQLEEAGLKPARGQSPAGRIVWSRGRRFAHLFDKPLAVPKTPPTPAQGAAVEKARLASIAARTCTQCSGVVGRKHDLYGGLCEGCQQVQSQEKDREQVIAIAAAYLARPEQYVVLDTETTGLDYNAEAVQIAVIDMESTVLLDTLVRPGCPLSEGATAVHGLTAADVADAPTFPLVHYRLAEVLRDKVAIAFNSDFDEGILYHEARRYELPPLPVQRWRCAIQVYAVFVGDWSEYHGNYRWYPLPNAAHHAAADCRATLALLRSMARHAL
jgi:DNA polymerase III epsilon subunit-like protein